MARRRRRIDAAPTFQNIAQLEELARSRIPEMTFQYYVGGAEDEVALAGARAAFGRHVFVPRVLRDVSTVELETQVLGTSISMPAIVAPTGFHKLAHPEGEVATARGAAAAKTIMTASTIANCSLEEIAAASNGPKWFQLYVFKDRALTQSLVERAEKAGYEAIVLTVDVPVAGRRERDLRTGFHLPRGVRMGNFDAGVLASRTAGSSLNHFIASQFDASLDWDDVRWLRGITKLPIVLKGVLSPEDAKLALRANVQGLVVSNHGGRQLDHSIAPLDALPEIAKVVKGRLEVYMDGGVRRGTDILKALALGAKAVLLGRPILWGLGTGGAPGVQAVLEHLRTELATSMRILGVTRPSDVDASYLAPA